MTMKIVSNQVECLKCGDTPYSTHRHDFRYCKCGSVAVDGGQEYLRRVGNIGGYKELSIRMEETHLVKLVEAVQWAETNGRNEVGIVYAVLRAIRDCGLTISEKS